jgi:hypothetical protein
MQSDPNIPPLKDNPQTGGAPPPLAASQPPVIGDPPPPDGASPPPLRPNSNRKSVSLRDLLAFLLSLCLGLFLADGVISLVDDSLIFFFDVHLLAFIRVLVFFFATLLVILTYGLMGLTPMIPKRLFLPLALFVLVTQLLFAPLMIYAYGWLRQVAIGLSVCQIILGLSILYWSRGGLKFRWPLVAQEQLGVRRFSWRNLAGFVLANVFLLLPAVTIYLLVCASLAVGHFTDGFLALRPGGLTAQVRKYVRNDGKSIQLFPMSHVADAAFYKEVSQSFPSNSIVLMEGVSDEKNLMTNHITYKRMATALGLSEQHEEFKETQGHGEFVRADVDIQQFSTNTIGMLNLVMLLHAKGLNVETLLKLRASSEPTEVQEQLIDDLLTKRNKHLLQEIQARLSQSEILIVPWGAMHMPEIAKEIQKSGFRLEESKDYVVIRFHFL